ncbi:MAG: hypothetical protein RLY78_4015 [Pseudomonadota bacterium]|jgi:23S rRNA pseudouridine1911/1915/1917 synthase|uniref:Pseudouridine synthase n=1 Tax=Pseudaquabacterium rugosum TaxID=2984194 RepID=A0ABU9BBJ2_9BURK
MAASRPSPASAHPETAARPDEALADDLLDDEDGVSPGGAPSPRPDLPSPVIRHIVDAVGHGQRLDRVLVGLAPEHSRSHLQQLAERGHVRLDGQPVTTPSRKLRQGQHIALELVPPDEVLAWVPQSMALDIRHEDAHLMVLHKPAGLVVHPAAGNWSGTLLNGLLAHHAAAATLPRAGIVHRLDKDTSGLMVVAKSLPAHTALVRAIAAREVRRVYLALAHGAPVWDAQAIDAPIGRDPVSRLRMAVVAGAKPARTDVEVLARARLPEGQWLGGLHQGAVSALRCRLHTGRTHQIRVHLASRGLPLLADALYGGRPALGLQRQALHAVALSFVHPHDGRTLALRAAPPPDFGAAWAAVAGALAPWNEG